MAKYDTVALTKWAEYHAKRFWINARKCFGDKIGTMPRVVMNARLTSTGGRAFLEDNFIDLSCYLMINNQQKYIDVIIPHELCHMIAFRLHGDKGHGPHWKYTMIKMGLTPDRCHDMETLAQARGG